MKILLLEDDDNKRAAIASAVREVTPQAEIIETTNWLNYVQLVNKTKFDMILLDLLVPRSAKDPQVEDHSTQLIEATRSFESRSFRTPAIVITRYLAESEDFLRDLNHVDINVISFDDSGKWKDALKIKLLAAEPKPHYPFVIVCALAKEAEAYAAIGYAVGELKTVSELMCREITIGSTKGVIVQAPRMGLVTGAVIATLAIERFDPRLVCMSGICGGIPGSAEIYDVLISEVCHQHDVGKWSDTGFKAEHYDIQVRADVRNRLEELTSSAAVKQKMIGNLKPRKSEFPDGVEEIQPELKLVATSSGSAVLAQEGKTSSLASGQRKLAGFDMEVFAVYEAARLSLHNPAVFSAKAVVDDGGKNKGDKFHRIGCLLSAQFVGAAIESGMCDVVGPR